MKIPDQTNGEHLGASLLNLKYIFFFFLLTCLKNSFLFCFIIQNTEKGWNSKYLYE